jgi:hypothetical protein
MYAQKGNNPDNRVDLIEDVKEGAKDVGRQAKAAAEDVQEGAKDIGRKAKSAAQEAGENARDGVEGAAQQFKESAKQGSEKPDNSIEGVGAYNQRSNEQGNVKGRMGETIESAKGGQNDATERGQRAASEVKDDSRPKAEKIGARSGAAWDDVKGTGQEKKSEDGKDLKKGDESSARGRAAEMEDWTNN